MHIRIVHKTTVIGEIYEVHPSEIPKVGEFIEILNPNPGAEGRCSVCVIGLHSSFEPEPNYSDLFDKFGIKPEEPENKAALLHWKIVNI